MTPSQNQACTLCDPITTMVVTGTCALPIRRLMQGNNTFNTLVQNTGWFMLCVRDFQGN